MAELHGKLAIWLARPRTWARLRLRSSPPTLGAAGGGLVVQLVDVDAPFAKLKASPREPRPADR